ncbi:MobH family relaxase (plasmid) [Robbsia andropogonis]|uniref:MobH family relaxase n=1 Tax=Robbsia andropogonis TaxID=28092 RepID=UPI003D1E66CA
MTDGLLIGAALSLLAGAYWLHRSRPPATAPVAPASGHAARDPRARPPAPSFLPVMRYDELVASTEVAGRIAKIEQKLAFAPNNFHDDVLPLLQRFSEFVQLLPASESHHHAQPGGLLIHLIEVAEYALHFRDSYKLPIGASTEEQARLGARYSYAVLVAALLHDIGKPVADVRVRTVGSDNGEPRTWTALAGAMLEQRAVWYSVDFPNAAERDYKAHQRLPVVLLQRIVPSSTLAWLGEYPPLLQELMSYLGGEEGHKDGMIATIVKRADSFSVADNLKSGSRIRFASATAVPLIERLMRGMRDLLAQGGLSLNRPGAVGFCDGEHVWFVAGTLADAVRQYLDQTEQRLSGAAGLPTDNLRFFDTWQEYGALVPNEAGTSIWEVAIQIGTWSQKLRVLKFELTLLYGSLDRAPTALPKGTIVPVADKRNAGSVSSGTGKQTLAVSDSVSAPNITSAVSDSSIVQDAASARAPHALDPREPTACTDGTDSGPVAPAAPVNDHPAPETVPYPNHAAPESAPDPVTAAPAQEDDYPDFGDVEEPAATAAVIAAPVATAPASVKAEPADSIYLDEADMSTAAQPTAPAPETVSAPVRPKEKTKAPPKGAGGRKVRPNAERLMGWVQEGVRTGELLFNESKGFVHFVDEGMLLISPKVFKEFAQVQAEHIIVPESKTDKPLWRVVQDDFQASSYPLKAPNVGRFGSYLHYFTVSGAESAQLAANLVPDAGRFFDPVPASNALLSRTEATTNK